MTSYHLQQTSITPVITWQDEQHELLIKGICCPIDAQAFFAGLLGWLKENSQEFQQDVRFVFCLPFFNSASAKAVYQVINQVKEICVNRPMSKLVWVVEDEDDFMIDAKEDFEELLEVKFEVLNQKKA